MTSVPKTRAQERATRARNKLSPGCGALGGVFCFVAAVLLLAGSSVARAASASVAVSDGWFRYITPHVPAGGYMRLSNPSSKPAILVGASSPACDGMMLHRSETGNGADTMVPVRQVTIPPKGSVSFEPGGYHLMCMQPRMEVGQTVNVTLALQGGQAVAAQFAVFGASGKPVQH